MPIALKLADETTPAYAPVFEPLPYAGVGVRSAPPRTFWRIARDVAVGLLRRVGKVLLLLCRVLPAMLALVAYVVLFGGKALALVLTGVARTLLWVARLRPTRAVAAVNRWRVPYAQIA